MRVALDDGYDWMTAPSARLLCTGLMQAVVVSSSIWLHRIVSISLPRWFGRPP